MEMQMIKAAKVVTEALDVGPTSKLWLTDAVAQPQGAPFSAGICEIWPGDPVEFDYDIDAAVCYMLEGKIVLTEDGVSQDFEPGDIIYVPQKEGLLVGFSAPEYGKFFYVTYPHWR
jgi:ethanolamine utilization protein EutQ (cupin superfamily)